ncbi:MAG TPA: TetR/AcrR family transcriptional regulator [Chloroflexota bacterium]|nr:TetR/AcrR family transcriptional regulator [Chloroflexota bacterium]
MAQPVRMLTPPERRRQNREAMLDAIREVSIEIMREQGVAGLSLHEVARRVSLRVQSLYKYFPSKAALYDALFRQAARLLAENDRQVWEGTAPTWERVDTWLRSRLDFAQRHAPLYDLLTGAAVPGFSPSPESLAAAREIGEMGTRAIGDLVQAGIITSGIPPRRAMNVLLVTGRGIVAETLGKERMLDDPDRFADLIPDVLDALRVAWSHERSDS